MGVSTTVALASSRNPALSTEPVTVTATLAGVGATPDGGTLIITDAFDGSTLASGPVTASDLDLAVTMPFAAGTHELTATYSGHGWFDGSTGLLTQTSSPDTAVVATNLAVTPSTFYPVKDGYRDTVSFKGKAGEPVDVVVSVYNAGGTRVGRPTWAA